MGEHQKVSSFFIQAFPGSLTVDTGHVPGPQLNPLQKCILISHMVMGLLIWLAQSLECCLYSNSMGIFWSFPEDQRPSGTSDETLPNGYLKERGQRRRKDYSFVAKVNSSYFPACILPCVFLLLSPLCSYRSSGRTLGVHVPVWLSATHHLGDHVQIIRWFRGEQYWICNELEKNTRKLLFEKYMLP